MHRLQKNCYNYTQLFAQLLPQASLDLKILECRSKFLKISQKTLPKINDQCINVFFWSIYYVYISLRQFLPISLQYTV